jgi:hypothetical protein
VRDLGGVQAQEPSAAALALRVRSSGLTAAEVERARVVERTVVRTWGMRGTLHLLAASDLGWLLPLLGPVFSQGSRRRRLELGLDDETTARGVRLLNDVLTRESPLTRAEIVERVGAQGLHLEGQAAPHLIGQAARARLVCYGPDRDNEPTYVLLSEWVACGLPLPREEALAELARRYLAAYGPAGPEDLAHWSGLSLADVRAAWRSIADEIIAVEVARHPAGLRKDDAAWLDEPPAEPPAVRLLPSFDTYLLGYRDRNLVVAPEYARHIHPGGGVLHPTLLIGGRAAGTWRIVRRRAALEVAVEPFDTLADALLPLIETEAMDVGRFLDTPATLRILPSR